MEVASNEIGITEILGKEKNNPRIVEYFTATSYRASNDETPWCAAFVNWCLVKSGVAGTKSAAALSFKDWGAATKNPKVGDIAVIDYGGGRGHVGFIFGFEVRDKKEYIQLLGGNQDDKVQISLYDRGKFTHFRTVKTAVNSSTVVTGSVAAGIEVSNILLDVANTLSTSPEAAEAFTGVSTAIVAKDWLGFLQHIISLALVVYIIVERKRKLKQINF